MTFELDSRLAADTIPVGDLALSSVLLLNDARFPWFVLVPRIPGASEITDLSDEQAGQLMQEIRIATRVMLMSAYHLTRAQLERAQVGEIAFLPKPYCFETLRAQLARLAGSPDVAAPRSALQAVASNA